MVPKWLAYIWAIISGGFLLLVALYPEEIRGLIASLLGASSKDIVLYVLIGLASLFICAGVAFVIKSIATRIGRRRRPAKMFSTTATHPTSASENKPDWNSTFGDLNVEAFAWFRINSKAESIEISVAKEGDTPREPPKSLWGDSIKLWNWIKEQCKELSRPREIEEMIPQLYNVTSTRAKALHRTLYPGPGYRLQNVEVVNRSIGDLFRVMHLRLTFRPTNWFVYAALNLNLDERVFSDENGIRYSIRERVGKWQIIKDTDNLNVSPLSNLFSIAALLVTGDHKTILSHRSSKSIVNAEIWQASIAEGTIPLDEQDGQPNPCKTIVRGFDEELGLNIEGCEIKFLAMAIDRPLLSPFLCARVNAPNITERDLRELPKTKAKGFWEHGGNLKIVDFDLNTLANELQTLKLCSPGQMCIIFSLVNEYGYDKVMEALRNPKDD